jgi:hypothetical protein
VTVVDKDGALLRQLAQQEPDKGRKVRYELQVGRSVGRSAAAAAGMVSHSGVHDAADTRHCPALPRQQLPSHSAAAASILRQDIAQPISFEHRGFTFVIDKVDGLGCIGAFAVLFIGGVGCSGH